LSNRTNLTADVAVSPPGAELGFPEPHDLSSRDVLRLLCRVWAFARPYKRHLLYLFLLVLPGLPSGLFALVIIRMMFDVVGHGAALTPGDAWVLQLPLNASREAILWRISVLIPIAIIIVAPGPGSRS
jgi:hypothetical protein